MTKRTQKHYATPQSQAAPAAFQTALGQWQLQRFPARKFDPLQAWDAGDELLHECIQQHSFEQPLLINDQWGALLVAVSHCKVSSMTDSYVSRCAWHHNIKLNALDCNFNALTPLDTLPTGTDSVFLKIPKSLSLLEFQLAKLATELKPGTPIFAAAKSKLFTPTVRELFQRYCDQVKVSLAQKKSRTLSAVLKPVDSQPLNFINTWSIPEYNLNMSHHAGVFSRQQLDIGARFLLENLPPSGAERVVDLGCGNGVLGLVYGQSSPSSQITWVDESYLAIHSTQLNIEQNLPPHHDYHTRVDDCLSQQATASVDLILCNPPFHQEHAITEHIARQMFRDAKRVLCKDGELWVVANRHLPYYQALTRLFKQVESKAQNSKFVILMARG